MSTLGTCVDQVRANVPLVHNITNYVTVNDVANVLPVSYTHLRMISMNCLWQHWKQMTGWRSSTQVEGSDL